MKVLIYEDNTEDLKSLIECIKKFFYEKELTYDLEICTESNQLYKHAIDHDLVFLDIEGNNENGIDIGINIRKINPDIKLIFISNFSKYLIDGYKANANRYFLKPIKQEWFNLELENVLNDYLQNNVSFTDHKIYPNKIYIKQILYVEFKNRKTYLHLFSGKVIETPYPLKYWIEKLEKYHFKQSYKSFLVNLRQISSISKIDVILLNDEKIPLSRIYKKDLERGFLECLKIMV